MPLSDHTCNAWCAPPQHAHLVLIDPQCTTQDDVLTHLAAPYAALPRERLADMRVWLITYEDRADA